MRENQYWRDKYSTYSMSMGGSEKVDQPKGRWIYQDHESYGFQEYVDQFPQKNNPNLPGWWFNQPIFKICLSNLIISPKFGVKIKDIWNHHPGAFSGWFHLPSCQVLRVERFSEFSGLSTMRLGRMDRDVRRIPGEKKKIAGKHHKKW